MVLDMVSTVSHLNDIKMSFVTKNSNLRNNVEPSLQSLLVCDKRDPRIIILQNGPLISALMTKCIEKVPLDLETHFVHTKSALVSQQFKRGRSVQIILST